MLNVNFLLFTESMFQVWLEPLNHISHLQKIIILSVSSF